MSRYLPALLLLLLPAAAHAQQAAPSSPLSLHYEVVNIRESKPEAQGGMISVRINLNPHSSHASMENITYQMLLVSAFGIGQYQLDPLPKDLPFAFFNIQLSSGEDTDAALKAMSDDQAKETQQRMLQEVLADRFHLKYHFVTVDKPSDLLVAGGKVKMHPSAVKPSAPDKPQKQDKDDPSAPWMDFKFSQKGMAFTARGQSMDFLAREVSTHMGAPVANHTSLAGLWDFTLEWSMPFQNRMSATAGADTDVYPPLEAALAEQLGLRLEHGKAPLKMLVVDHLEAPTPN